MEASSIATGKYAPLSAGSIVSPFYCRAERVTVSIDATAEGRAAGPIGKISVIPVDPPSTPPEGYRVIAPFDFETDSTTRYASAGTCCVSLTVTVCSLEGTIDTETKIGYIYCSLQAC